MTQYNSIAVNLPDGNYYVHTPTIGAGFVVRNGRVAITDCAPILWRRLPFWVTRAKRTNHG